MSGAAANGIEPAAYVARMETLARLTHEIQGWLYPRAGRLLYDIAAGPMPGEIAVELGAWKGKSAVWIAAAFADRGRGRLHAVDTWAGTETEPQHAELLAGYDEGALEREFRGHMERCGVGDRVEAIRATTRDAALAWKHGVSIGLLHVDAGHEYEHVREDFELWAPLVLPGGYIVFDDVPSWEGPSRVVGELPRWYVPVAHAPNKWVVQKLAR